MKVLGLICVLFGASHAATIVELLASESSTFSTLVSLVTKAGLVDALNSGTFTIFAPTNAAFNKLPSATLTALGNDVTALTNVLKFHVVQGSVYKSAVSNELKLTMLNGQKARFNIYTHNDVVTAQGAAITDFDDKASNGVIHVLADVMLPPEGDIVDKVVATSDLSTLLSFVQKAGIASALKGDNLTLLAPTNSAFSRLTSSTVAKLNTDSDLLTDILKYHVIPHTEFSKGLYNREYINTLDKNNDRISIREYSGYGLRINSRTKITKADIGTTNGVIHEIDHVLIPARYYRDLYFGK